MEVAIKTVQVSVAAQADARGVRLKKFEQGKGRSGGRILQVCPRNDVSWKCRVMQFTVWPQCRSLRCVIDDSSRAKLRCVLAEIRSGNAARSNCVAQSSLGQQAGGKCVSRDRSCLLPLPLVVPKEE